MYKVKHTPTGLFYKPQQKQKDGDKCRRKDLHEDGKIYDTVVNATRALKHLERYGYYDCNGAYFKDCKGEFIVSEASIVYEDEDIDNIVHQAMVLYEEVLLKENIRKVLIVTRKDLLKHYKHKNIKDITIEDFECFIYKRTFQAEMVLFFDKQLPITSVKVLKDRYGVIQT